MELGPADRKLAAEEDIPENPAGEGIVVGHTLAAERMAIGVVGRT